MAHMPPSLAKAHAEGPKGSPELRRLAMEAPSDFFHEVSLM